MRTLLSGTDGLELREVETPDPRADQVLVQVAAAGINRADVMSADRGPSDIPLGLEFAGEVVAVGEAVLKVRAGDQVMGLVPNGGHSTHVLLPEAHCVSVPQNLSLLDAGVIPEVFVTAWDALVQADLRPGDRVLVNGVGSGVGTAAIQLIRLMGAISIGTSRTPEKLERAIELGLDEPVLMEEGTPTTPLEDVDVVLELLGGPYLSLDLEVTRDRATIVVIGRVAGPSCKLDIGTVMYKRLRLIGTALRPRSIHEKAELMGRFEHEVVPHLATEALVPVSEGTVPLAQADEAYERVRANQVFGKLALVP